MDEVQEVRAVASAAKQVVAQLRSLTREQKDEALLAIAAALRSNTQRLVAVNQADVAAAIENGTSPGIVDRLTLTAERIEAIADAVVDIAALPDPVGEVIRGFTLPNGLQVRQLRVPMGVVGMIYEARPNVTVDAAALCLKSGNAALLRGSSSAYASNEALVEVMQQALATTEVPVEAIQLVPGRSHDSVKHLMTARGLVDLIIPRGGAGLIQTVVAGSTVPVIETGVGNCHVYVDAAADLEMATEIVINAKAQRPSVCNAAETLLVHEDIAPDFFTVAGPRLSAAGITLHADEAVMRLCAGTELQVQPVTDEAWANEFYSLDLAVGVVSDVQAATAHIRKWSSGHTEAIVSDSARAIEEFINGVDSAAVMVNASTRFTDGGEFGFGAEIGISTQKLHARGPMALPELTTTTYIVTGHGQIRQ